MEFLTAPKNLFDFNIMTTSTSCPQNCSVVCSGVYGSCTQGFTCNSSLYA